MIGNDLISLLTHLHDAGVEFLVVGGAAAVFSGAPIVTFDLDIVHRRTPENTNLGKLDVLCELAQGEGYDELLPHAFEHKVAGRSVLVLGLEKVTEAKARAGRPKDKAVLPVLLATLDERKKAKL